MFFFYFYFCRWHCRQFSHKKNLWKFYFLWSKIHSWSSNQQISLYLILNLINFNLFIFKIKIELKFIIIIIIFFKIFFSYCYRFVCVCGGSVVYYSCGGRVYCFLLGGVLPTMINCDEIIIMNYGVLLVGVAYYSWVRWLLCDLNDPKWMKKNEKMEGQMTDWLNVCVCVFC